MQTLAASVWRSLSAAAPDSVLVANRSSGRAPLRWLVTAFVRTAQLVARRRVDLVIAGDAAAYALVVPLTVLFRLPSAVLVHGLDLTYGNPVYRFVVPRAVKRAPHVLANSEATAAVAVELGISRDRVHVLRLGVQSPDVTEAARTAARKRLNSWLGVTDADLVCLTVGRLVKRKGAVWFVESVLPRLPPSVVYVVAGQGDDAARLNAAIASLGPGARVHALGRVDDEARELLLRGADVFVQPNVRVPDDMEGFGLAGAEAASRGLLVVASDIDGIADAIVDGVTGTLLPPGDVGAWVAELTLLAADPTKAAELGASYREAARQRFSETAMGADLVRLLGLGTMPSV